jgi:hypothetical protein
MHLQHSLVRDASSSLFLQQNVTSSTSFRSHSATSPVSAPPALAHKTSYKASAITMPAVTTITSPLVVPALTGIAAESNKKLQPLLPSFVAPPKQTAVLPSFVAPPKQTADNSWSELKNEQLQRATRCCGELLQRASYNTFQITALKALCEQQQRDLHESKVKRCCGAVCAFCHPELQADAAAALSRLAAFERSSGPAVSAG